MKQLHKFDKLKFQDDLLQWYEQNKRDLPWRKTKDPYKIWVSEIMLQQTQVKTVIPYYESFIKRFPTVHHLAEAEEQEVLKEWEGLGYYSRARNLQAAAKEVVSSYNGLMPNNKKELLKLKGIGPYTSGAISSIAFKQAEAAVDGNVMRVLSRILLIDDNIIDVKTRKLFEEIVYELISKEDPSSFNQGLMELGALICTPKNPQCFLCPVQTSCRAFDRGAQLQLPVRIRPNKKRIEAYMVLLIKNKDGDLLIEQRGESGLLANMWQFPMASVNDVAINEIEKWVYDNYHIHASLGDYISDVKHIFSHKIWELTVYEMTVTDMPDVIRESNMKNKVCFEPLNKLKSYPISVSHKKIEKMYKKTLA